MVMVIGRRERGKGELSGGFSNFFVFVEEGGGLWVWVGGKGEKGGGGAGKGLFLPGTARDKDFGL
jgi:hypothetical protein